MPDHVFTIRARRKDNLVVRCTCGVLLGETDEIALDRLIEIARRHMDSVPVVYAPEPS